jgi:hypothetical protein
MDTRTDLRRRELSPDSRRSTRNTKNRERSRENRQTTEADEGTTSTTTPTLEVPQANINEDSDVEQDGPIRSTTFPMYKLYRRLNMKLTSAKHHLQFLSNLRENHQVPKGLKPKATVTTTELPARLFIRWEQAHIELANSLRDILLDHWQEVVTETESELKRIFDDLKPICTQEELNTILSLIKKAVTQKEEELQKKRTNKERNLRKTGGSGGTNRSRSRTRNN